MAGKYTKNDQKNILKILALILLIGAAIFVWSRYRQPGSESDMYTKSNDSVLPKNALLTLSTADKNIAQGESFTVKLMLDSKDQGVEAADFTINFDPAYLQVNGINSGNFFKTYPVKRTESNFVKISGVAYFDGQSVIVPKGRAEVAGIEFTALAKVQNTPVKIDRDQTIVASNGQNILNFSKITDLKISVK